MENVHVFTSAALNYIPKVRLLFQSVRKHHPEWIFHLALADELPPDIDLSSEGFDEVVTVQSLGIPAWRGWAFCHTIVELSTAIKPFMLSRLLNTPGVSKVIYLDPDIVVFSPLDDILEALDNSNIVLTPHQITPEETLPAIMDNEICSLKYGIYNLGFVGVSATDIGRAFAEWWSQRCYYFCRADIPNGLFTDQRWVDLVPAFFSGVAIVRNSRHNVATWNLTTRKLHRDLEGRYMVDGDLLGFYHFTGFDSGAHQVMAAKNAGDNPDVQAMINWYVKETKKLAKDPLAKRPWAFGNFTNGMSISPQQRIVYRERIDLQGAYPDPFESEGYLQWWGSQGALEYPPIAQKSRNNQTELSGLTPGFRNGERGTEGDNAFSILKRVIANPRVGMSFAKKGWEVLRNEGFNGLRRRITN